MFCPIAFSFQFLRADLSFCPETPFKRVLNIYSAKTRKELLLSLYIMLKRILNFHLFYFYGVCSFFAEFLSVYTGAVFVLPSKGFVRKLYLRTHGAPFVDLFNLKFDALICRRFLRFV